MTTLLLQQEASSSPRAAGAGSTISATTRPSCAATASHGEACAFTLDSFVELNRDERLDELCRRGIPVITTMLHEGATFRNRLGEEFLPDKHANKDAISRAIFAEVKAGRGIDGGVWYDATGVSREILKTRYADTMRRYAAYGIDISREPMLVAPAPHTSLGGISIDARCRVLRADGTTVPGLFAAGEVTGGVHGRNRLGGNAGTEVLVFGKIAGMEAAAYATRT